MNPKYELVILCIAWCCLFSVYWDDESPFRQHDVPNGFFAPKAAKQSGTCFEMSAEEGK